MVQRGPGVAELDGEPVLRNLLAPRRGRTLKQHKVETALGEEWSLDVIASEYDGVAARLECPPKRNCWRLVTGATPGQEEKIRHHSEPSIALTILRTVRSTSARVRPMSRRSS